MSEEKWGYGNGWNNLDGTPSKPFLKTFVSGNPVELLTGEFPHSRNSNSHYARWPDGRIEAFDGHYVLPEITFRAENYLKTSGLSGDEVRKGGQITIKANNELIYEVFWRDPLTALLRAHYLLGELMGHSSDVFRNGLKSIVGRKVYYRNTPAIITASYPNGIILETDGVEVFPPGTYELNDQDFPYEPSETIKDDLLSPHIWWYRK